MFIQLTDAQRSVLEPACTRDDLCVFPVTAGLKGGAVGNVCKSLLKRGLLREVPASDTLTIWRYDDGGVALTLQATDAGKQAIAGKPVITPPQKPALTPANCLPPLTCAKESGQDTLVRLLGRPEGATIGNMAQATGWQPHSVRGALSGVIGKKLGLSVTSTKQPGHERVYKVT